MRALAILPVFFLVVHHAALAQKAHGHCSGGKLDSLWLAAGPVYRDCEVDRKAELRGNAPRLNYTPPLDGPRCRQVELEFVVDTLGQPELSTLRTRSANAPSFEDAVREVVPSLHYLPARLADRPVRQLVVYKEGIVSVIVVSPSGMPPRAPPRPPAGC